jgi:lysophospholipid acyltransferase (LPLAT)-like uncharacterized protein
MNKKILFLLATNLAWLVILFFGKVCRMHVKHRHRWDRAIAEKRGVIAILWHGKMLIPIYIHRYQGIAAMVSEHHDGEMIAQTVHKLGYETVRGSSTRGGSRAFRQMLSLLKKGKTCTVLPDGPKGPRHHVKLGVIALAQRSGACIIPLTFSARKKICLTSWDRFTLFWPFSRVCLLYGRPMVIPPKIPISELESYRLEVENALKALDREADEYFQ